MCTFCISNVLQSNSRDGSYIYGTSKKANITIGLRPLQRFTIINSLAGIHITFHHLQQANVVNLKIIYD
jgi:hypothetical protein